jgi:hypothetical protein
MEVVTEGPMVTLGPAPGSDLADVFNHYINCAQLIFLASAEHPLSILSRHPILLTPYNVVQFTSLVEEIRLAHCFKRRSDQSHECVRRRTAIAVRIVGQKMQIGKKRVVRSVKKQ